MATFNPAALLPADGSPGPWGPSVPIGYTERDVLLYAVGIGCTDLRQVYEGAPGFGVFPSFAIRWGGVGLQVDEAALPPSPGPLNIDAERAIEPLAPLPLPVGDQTVTVQVRSRLLAVHPRGTGSAMVEMETEVHDDGGRPCVRITTGLFRRGVAQLGDIAPFEGRGTSRSVKRVMPDRAPDLQVQARIGEHQAVLYRLSGDRNPLHIDPAAARFGGFPSPILHGLCTYGHCAQMLVGALCGGDVARLRALRLRFSSPVYPGDALRLLGWHRDGQPGGELLFEVRTGSAEAERTVVNHGSMAWSA